MSQTTYLLRVTDERDFNAMVAYLKDKGYNWGSGELTYQEAKETYFKDSRRVMLLRGMYNGITKKHEIQLTYLARLNNLMCTLGLPQWTMKQVQTAIPIEYYK